MKRSAGFTLIELIIVIVILGILAVTAAPKFMNMQGDARAATLNGMKGAVQSAATMVYSKAIIKGVDKAPTSSAVTTDGTTTVTTIYGYPDASANGIAVVVDASSADWTGKVSAANSSFAFTPAGMTSGAGATCAVVYTLNASPAAPTVTTITSGC